MAILRSDEHLLLSTENRYWCANPKVLTIQTYVHYLVEATFWFYPKWKYDFSPCWPVWQEESTQKSEKSEPVFGKWLCFSVLDCKQLWNQLLTLFFSNLNQNHCPAAKFQYQVLTTEGILLTLIWIFILIKCNKTPFSLILIHWKRLQRTCCLLLS